MTDSATNPVLVVLAGPNGAGKSTFYEAYLANLGLPFLNADVLAAETGMDAYEASAQISAVRRVLVERGVGFVMETVLSDPVGAKIEFLSKAVDKGFNVHLIYIGIADAEMSAKRVASRVETGGHDVPPEKIMARYTRTLDNLKRAIARLPQVTIYDNSNFEEPYRFLAELRSGQLVRRTKAALPAWFRNTLVCL